jgi:hypothetical protein
MKGLQDKMETTSKEESSAWADDLLNRKDV